MGFDCAAEDGTVLFVVMLGGNKGMSKEVGAQRFECFVNSGS